MFNKIENWCIQRHEATNHYYDKYLPYSFHLRMADQVRKDFEYLLDNTVDLITGKTEAQLDREKLTYVTLREAASRAVWGHDTIEDTRTSYNEVKEALGQEAADIIYAVTNEKGRNRAERANAAYYKGIRETPGAIFVKLCDRIANVQYGKLTKSSMFEKYGKENLNFLVELGYSTDHQLKPMFDYLISLFH